MSDLLTDRDLAPERETVREPAKRWRNKYGALDFVYVNGNLKRPGDTWLASLRHSTEEEALLAAEAEWSRLFSWVRESIEHLGAFPVDENGEPL